MKASGILAAIFAALCMGTMGVFSRKTGFDPELITFFRLFVGALFLTSLLLVTGKTRLLCKWPSWPVLINGLMLAGFIMFYVQAMNYTTMANAIMILYLAPLLVSIFAHFFMNERLNLISLLLIGGSLLGFAMMMEFAIDFHSGSDQALGLGYALLGLLCYSTFILINRVIPADIHVYNRTFYQLLTGSLCLVPFTFINFPVIHPEQYPWIIGTGLIPGFLGTLLAVIALDRLPAATFGTLAYFEPIFVVALGWILFSEHLSTLQIAGGSLILLCGGIKGYLATAGDTDLQQENSAVLEEGQGLP